MSRQLSKTGQQFLSKITRPNGTDYTYGSQLNTEPSATVPDEAMSIKDLFEQAMRGQALRDDLQRDNFYGEDEPDHDDIDLGKAALLDPADAADLRLDLARQNAIREGELKRQQESPAAKQKIDEIQKDSSKSTSTSSKKKEVGKAQREGDPAGVDTSQEGGSEADD